MVRNFMRLLRAKWDERKFVCVGLDSDASKLPILHLGMDEPEDRLLAAQEAYRRAMKAKPGSKDARLKVWQRKLLAKAQLEFNKRIVDATKDIVCAFKPNVAFYEALGDAGWATLIRTIEYINKVAPDVPVILDCKRGDIGNTNLGYVMAAALADAVTVHNYLGVEAMKPFLDQEDKGVIVLCRTSNPGAGEFQDEEVVVHVRADGTAEVIPLYQRVATNVADSWNYNGNCCVVAGATYPEELDKIRRIVGSMPILIPGIGKQGGDLEAAVRNGVDVNMRGIIVNNSSAVLFASPEVDFAEAARAAALKMHDDINAVLATS